MQDSKRLEFNFDDWRDMKILRFDEEFKVE
jgi:hypothetical protein